MKETPYTVEHFEEEESFELKEIIQKYLRYWPWFVLATVFCIGIGYAYMRWAPIIYKSQAKIKIIDESQEVDIASSALSLLSGKSKINLENEIEILKSYRILSQVVNELHLDISFYEVGNVKTRRIWAPPFQITRHIAADSLNSSKPYLIEFKEGGVTITDVNEQVYTPNLKEPAHRRASLQHKNGSGY